MRKSLHPKKKHLHRWPHARKRPLADRAQKPSAPPSPIPDRKEPVLAVPLDREHWLQRLQETIQKLKDAGQSVTSWAMVLEQWAEVLRAEWNRSNGAEALPPEKVPYIG